MLRERAPMTLLAVLALVASLAEAAIARPQPAPAGQDTGPAVTMAAMKGDAVEVPIILAGPLILVDDVFVNGEGPFRFMLDTGGMGGGRVDASLVEKLGLQPTGTVQAGDGTNRGTIQMPAFELASLDVGGLHYEGVRVLSRDYNEHGAAVRGHIDGVLGFALFENYLLTIDYAGRMLRIGKGALPSPNGEDVLAMTNDGAPGVEVQIAGQSHPARFDTGSMGSITVSQEIADTLEFSTAPEVIGQARTAGGAFSISRAKLAGDVRIGATVIEEPYVVIAGPIQEVNIGGATLKDYVVTYDQGHARIRIVPALQTPTGAAPLPGGTRLGMATDRLQALLDRMEGEFTIEARMFVPGRDEPIAMTGHATWTKGFMGRFGREAFTLETPRGELSGVAFMGPVAEKGYFELVQVDEFSASMFHVTGPWDPEAEAIVLEQIIPAGEHPGVSRMPLKWIYRFGEGESFVKEMQVQRPDGSWMLASDYHYVPVK